jgi:imidazolonepropionase
VRGAAAMPSTLITNIGELVTNDPAQGDGSPLGILLKAAIVMEDGRIAWVGAAASAPSTDAMVDAGGRSVVPGFVDSHTHLVFAGDRSAEFAARMAGERYTGGGIMTTVRATRAASREHLIEGAARRRAEMIGLGTTTLEAKSGYGLTTPDEVRLLEITGELTEETTFLGAHVVPTEYAEDRAAYVDLVCGEMLDACAPHARWIDVFCDVGAFSADEARVHGNQLEHGEGVAVAVEFGAASVDHCDHLSGADVEALAGSGTVATLLPAADFSTRAAYPDARRLIDAGVSVALATDCNPGTAYVTSIPLCIALSVREMRMTPSEALWASTAGGARALRRTDIGTVSPGLRADAVVLDAPNHVHLAYRPGSPLIAAVWKDGERVR